MSENSSNDAPRLLPARPLSVLPLTLALMLATGGGCSSSEGGASASGGNGGTAAGSAAPNGGAAVLAGSGGRGGGETAIGGVTGVVPGSGGFATGGASANGGFASGGVPTNGGFASGGVPANGGFASGGVPANGGSANHAGESGDGAGGASAGRGGGGAAGATAGGTNSAGVGGSGGEQTACSERASTSTRPQLSRADAANYTIAKYLAQTGPLASLKTDDWDPTPGLGSASAFTADFTVAGDGSGTHTTVQAALNAVSGSARRYVLVKPGTYRETISYTGSTPLTIYGAGSDATEVLIVHSRSAAEGASQTFNARSNELQIMNLTLSNDFPTPASGNDTQALALLTNGDKIVLENVHLHGFQDTIQMQARDATTRSRVYIKDSFIEGDVDYIYGNATVVIEGSTIHYLSSRRGDNAGVMLAPSTSVGNSLGFLLIRCTFTGDAGAPTGNHLGRSWDASSTTPTPNGQAVIRESTLGAHVHRTAPWTSAATSGRAYSATGNRFYEYCNSGPGAGP